MPNHESTASDKPYKPKPSMVNSCHRTLTTNLPVYCGGVSRGSGRRLLLGQRKLRELSLVRAESIFHFMNFPKDGRLDNPGTLLRQYAFSILF